jgi:hypothetical protein
MEDTDVETKDGLLGMVRAGCFGMIIREREIVPP